MSHQRLLGGKDSGLASVKKFGAYVLIGRRFVYFFLVYKKIGCYNQGSVAKNMRGWTLPCALSEFRHGREAVGSIRSVHGSSCFFPLLGGHSLLLCTPRG